MRSAITVEPVRARSAQTEVRKILDTTHYLAHSSGDAVNAVLRLRLQFRACSGG